MTFLVIGWKPEDKESEVLSVPFLATASFCLPPINQKSMINDQTLWFPLRKALKNYTKLFEIKIIDKRDPLIQPNRTTDSAASLLKKELNEMKGIKHIDTLKLTFKKTSVDADKNKPKMIFKTAYFNCKSK